MSGGMLVLIQESDMKQNIGDVVLLCHLQQKFVVITVIEHREVLKPHKPLNEIVPHLDRVPIIKVKVVRGLCLFEHPGSLYTSISHVLSMSF